MGKTRNAARFVAPIFKDNNWKWQELSTDNFDYGQYIPTENEIYNCLKSLRKSAKEVQGWSSTGRLMARWDNETESVEYMLCLPDKE